MSAMIFRSSVVVENLSENVRQEILILKNFNFTLVDKVDLCFIMC